VINDEDAPRDLRGLVVPPVGSLEQTGDLFAPYRLVDGDGAVVVPVAVFFAELTACGRSATTQRSYGMDLLRWLRFLWALGVGWDQATRVEARDFIRWLQVTVKPARLHWRYPDGGAPGSGTESAVATVNAVSGKPSRGERYEAATVAHCESVLRGFYGFCLEAGSGPMLNPFPLARHARTGRVGAHHNPMEPFDRERRGRYRPKVVALAWTGPTGRSWPR
jgi:Phage integrase, N-terminal SAM-like domain